MNKDIILSIVVIILLLLIVHGIATKDVNPSVVGYSGAKDQVEVSIDDFVKGYRAHMCSGAAHIVNYPTLLNYMKYQGYINDQKYVDYCTAMGYDLTYAIDQNQANQFFI
jgi:hypothetical protein